LLRNSFIAHKKTSHTAGTLCAMPLKLYDNSLTQLKGNDKIYDKPAVEINMNIGLASARIVNNDIYHNLNTCIDYMKKAKKHNVNIILFGESFLQGFESLIWKPENDLSVGIKRKSEIINIFCKNCKRVNITAGIGYYEREKNKLYSSYLIVDHNGNYLINYRRISKGWRTKDSDDNAYFEGTEFPVFEFMGHKMTVGLCGDFWEDNVIEKMPKNIDIVLWPAFNFWDKNEWANEISQYINQSKKVCKNIFYVNSICNEKKSLAYGGAFAVINNELIALLDQEKEDILVIEYK